MLKYDLRPSPLIGTYVRAKMKLQYGVSEVIYIISFIV